MAAKKRRVKTVSEMVSERGIAAGACIAACVALSKVAPFDEGRAAAVMRADRAGKRWARADRALIAAAGMAVV